MRTSELTIFAVFASSKKRDYDFAIEYEDDPTLRIPLNRFSGLTAFALSAALQDIGLKLESTKAPVEVLVIDHVEKPSENQRSLKATAR